MFCTHCGAKQSDGHRCNQQRKAAAPERFPIPIMVLLAAMPFIFYGNCIAGKRAESRPGSAPVPPLSSASQADFEKNLVIFAAEYVKESNQIRKSEVFRRARTMDSAFRAGKHFEGWRGVLERLATPKGGDYAEFRIVSERLLSKGRPNAVEDNGDGTVTLVSRRPATYLRVIYHGSVSRGSEPYNQLASLPEDASVSFSGSFPDRQETSITEAGAMDAPEFEIALSAVQKR